MRVLFLTQYYPPEMGAPQARISEFARGLHARGWDVHVVTALPNYPSGRVFEGYRGRRVVREVRDGIPVTRTWLRPDASGRVAARLAAATTFALSATTACLTSRFRPDVLISESPPLTLGPAGALIAKALRAHYVMNVSDLWPGSLIEMGVLTHPLLVRTAYAVEACSYSAASLVTAQSPDIVQDIKARFPRQDVRLLSNGVDTRLFGPHLRSWYMRERIGVSDDNVLVTYAGLHGLAQGLDAVVKAAAQLASDRRIRFLLVGDGPAKSNLIQLAHSLGTANVSFASPIPRDEVAVLLASSDIVVVPLARRLTGAIPSKLYEAMASGVPVVAATGGGAARIVTESGAGLVVPPGDADAIADAVRRLADRPTERHRMGRRGRQMAVEQFDRGIWVDKLNGYLRELAG